MPAPKKASLKKNIKKTPKTSVNWMNFSLAIAVSAVVLAGIVVWQMRDQYVRNLTEGASNPSKLALVRVYFSNRLKSSGSGSCDQVFPVGRVVASEDRIEATISELLNGPTGHERDNGFNSFFSDKTKSMLKNIRVTNGTVYLNLNDIRPIIPNASSSCGSAQLMSEIDSTLKQFPEVKKVIVAINGKPNTFYDWIQVGCTAENNNCDDSSFK